MFQADKIERDGEETMRKKMMKMSLSHSYRRANYNIDNTQAVTRASREKLKAEAESMEIRPESSLSIRSS